MDMPIRIHYVFNTQFVVDYVCMLQDCVCMLQDYVCMLQDYVCMLQDCVCMLQDYVCMLQDYVCMLQDSDAASVETCKTSRVSYPCIKGSYIHSKTNKCTLVNMFIYILFFTSMFRLLFVTILLVMRGALEKPMAHYPREHRTQN